MQRFTDVATDAARAGVYHLAMAGKAAAPHCHCPLKLKAFVTSDKSLQRLLSELAEPTDVQGKGPARGPPYFASQVLRQRFTDTPAAAQLDFSE